MATAGGIAVAIWSDRLTRRREAQKGIEARRRDFRAYLQMWKREIDTLHFVGAGFERWESTFFNAFPLFEGQTELIRCDFGGEKRVEFERLVATITDFGRKTQTYNHDELIKALDALIAFLAIG